MVGHSVVCCYLLKDFETVLVNVGLRVVMQLVVMALGLVQERRVGRLAPHLVELPGLLLGPLE